MKRIKYIKNLNVVWAFVCVFLYFTQYTFANDAYSVDEQIRILEDKDYAQYLQQLEKEKALQAKARKRQALLRKKEKEAYEKKRRDQVKQRRQEQGISADESEQIYQKKIERDKMIEGKNRRKHIVQKQQEKQRIQKQQVLNRKKFYKSNPLSRQASPRVDRNKRKFF